MLALRRAASESAVAAGLLPFAACAAWSRSWSSFSCSSSSSFSGCRAGLPALGAEAAALKQRRGQTDYAALGAPGAKKAPSNTPALRRQLLEAATERGGGSGSGGLREVLRAFARKHVVVMTDEELREFELLLDHEDEMIWRWLEQPERTPAWVAANSTFGLLQQFASYWCREGREYS